MDMFEYVETALDESMNLLKTKVPYVRVNLLSGDFIIVTAGYYFTVGLYTVGEVPVLREPVKIIYGEDARIELADILGCLLQKYGETWDARDADSVL